MANTTKRAVENEPPGFAEFWARWYKNGTQHGRRAHYAEAFAAGQQTRANWIEPRSVVPRPKAGSLDAWPFAIPHDHEKQPTGHIPEAP